MKTQAYIKLLFRKNISQDLAYFHPKKNFSIYFIVM